MISNKLAKKELNQDDYLPRSSSSSCSSQESFLTLDQTSQFPCLVESFQATEISSTTRKRKLWDINSCFGTSNSPTTCNSIFLGSAPKNSLNTSIDSSDFDSDKLIKSTHYGDELIINKYWDKQSIEDELSANFEGSFAGLGIDVSVSAYNMSNSLLQTLPNISSVHETNDNLQKQKNDILNQNINVSDNVSESKINYTLNLEKFNISTLPVTLELDKRNYINNRNAVQNQYNLHRSSSNLENHKKDEYLQLKSKVSRCESSPDISQLIHNPVKSLSPEIKFTKSFQLKKKFQYILDAATSVATKLNEIPITYLNQGQLYELRLYCLHNDLEDAYESVIKVNFADRKLQYIEKEQIASWQKMHPNDRILEIDVPSSYGIIEVIQSPCLLNVCSVRWGYSTPAGVYLKIHCISTEFTPNKHGGEKGVPFRITIDTFAQNNKSEKLSSASCKIKVFKQKGADRKHKQDREKVSKQPLSEQNKYQSSQSFTILSEIDEENYSTSKKCDESNTEIRTVENINDATHHKSLFQMSPHLTKSHKEFTYGKLTQHNAYYESRTELSEWLLMNHFGQYKEIFSNYCATDLLQLTKEECIQLCDLADGIRLYNSLHYSFDEGSIYYALYLNNLTVSSFVHNIRALKLINNEVQSLFLLSPKGIHVKVTDQVIEHLPNDSLFLIEVLNHHLEKSVGQL